MLTQKSGTWAAFFLALTLSGCADQGWEDSLEYDVPGEVEEDAALNATRTMEGSEQMLDDITDALKLNDAGG